MRGSHEKHEAKVNFFVKNIKFLLYLLGIRCKNNIAYSGGSNHNLWFRNPFVLPTKPRGYQISKIKWNRSLPVSSKKKFQVIAVILFHKMSTKELLHRNISLNIMKVPQHAVDRKVFTGLSYFCRWNAPNFWTLNLNQLHYKNQRRKVLYLRCCLLPEPL